MLKQHDQGWAIGLNPSVVFGDLIDMPALLGQSTAYIERTPLVMRLFNDRLTRKTLAFSRQLDLYRASVTWKELV
jgi:IS1 family transposase